ncbi:sugar phosphate isomerase/epimerase family protein [Aquabacterium sp.]|uniref:sugar phosphate isomerase/epimerase family protein n=1 Tax=Aquabacterium sp. TaxID=1872578 RepID=UPI002BB2C78B|nr:sugar phosphate isomerase/epimerase family protein [Aquabacterium sp.]HSW08892.1 sugar phosphate isomerase/epimerase family protein [Aquabacterium sp.]
MKLALCNEVLRQLPFEQQCRAAAALGYAGLELAPFTLAADPTTLDARQARDLAAVAADHGLAISSLHWLLVQPEGLSLSTPDAALHARTVDFLKHLIDFAAASGAAVLVHGSPKQRSPGPGQTVDDAFERVIAGWQALAPHAQAAGVVYCIEPLAPFETPVMNTLAQAAAVVERIGSPALRTMLDLSAATLAENEPPATLLRRHLAAGHVAHVQLNDANRRGPGQGSTPVLPVLRVLKSLDYRGWLAIEPFDYHPDAMGCAAFSAGHVAGLLQALAEEQR